MDTLSQSMGDVDDAEHQTELQAAVGVHISLLKHQGTGHGLSCHPVSVRPANSRVGSQVTVWKKNMRIEYDRYDIVLKKR